MVTSRGVLSFEDQELAPPSELLLDTSFVVHALVEGSRSHVAAAAFLRQLLEAGTTIVFSRVLELELREAAYKLFLVDRYSNQWRRRRHDGRALRRAGRLVAGTIAAWQEVLGAFAHIPVEIGEVIDRVDELMGAFGLSSNDATMAATAEYAIAPTIVTTDAGFAAVPEDRLKIYTDRSRVGLCRRMRAGYPPS